MVWCRAPRHGMARTMALMAVYSAGWCIGPAAAAQGLGDEGGPPACMSLDGFSGKPREIASLVSSHRAPSYGLISRGLSSPLDAPARGRRTVPRRAPVRATEWGAPSHGLVSRAAPGRGPNHGLDGLLLLQVARPDHPGLIVRRLRRRRLPRGRKGAVVE